MIEKDGKTKREERMADCVFVSADRETVEIENEEGHSLTVSMRQARRVLRDLRFELASMD